MKNIAVLSGLVFYRFIFDMVYWKITSFVNFEAGFIWAPDACRIVLSWIMTIAMIFPAAGMFDRSQPSSLIVLFFNLIWFFPLQTLFAFQNFNFALYLLTMLYWLILMIGQRLMPVICLRPPEMIAAKGKKWGRGLIVAGAWAYIAYFSYRFTNFRMIFDVISSDTIDKFRREAALYDIPLIGRYLLSALFPVIIVGALHFLSSRRYMLFAAMMLAGYLHFSFDGRKTIFFATLLCVVGFVFYRDYMIKLVPWGASLLGIYSLAGFPYGGVAHSFYFRRICFVPVLLSEYYYRYFTSNPVDLWRYGVERLFGVDCFPYNGKISNMIGWLFMGTDSNANNGLIGDAFFSFGYFGVIIMPLVMILCLRLFDFFACGIPRRAVIGLCAFYAFLFTDGSLMAILLIHGYVLACVLLFYFPLRRIGDKHVF